MIKAVGEYLDTLKVARKQVYRNLTLFPLLSTYEMGLDYLTLDEALEASLLEVTEVDIDGSVPELRVENKYAGMVLIMDGEELVGAKQNRIVNTTILLPPKSTVVIPVSCVEQGRWSYDTEHFRSEKRVMPSGLRAMKAQQVNTNLKTYREYRADQFAIWDDIAARANRLRTFSPTGAMAAIYESNRDALSDYTTRFTPVQGQVGAVFMINGKVIGMDGFGKHETFGKVFNKLLSSYAIDAIDWCDLKKETKALKSKVTNFINASKGATIESHPSVGPGTDLRLESEKVIGFAVSLDDQILHLCIFPKENGQKGHGSDSGLVRFSMRRRNRL
ncbi:MAG: hypothetical protein DRH12_18335 [Deltaproteobacteria bacterium]|nr:MAG: hypothetical protein DRH12_18335 [Deltaproteobacteria bacterium]